MKYSNETSYSKNFWVIKTPKPETFILLYLCALSAGTFISSTELGGTSSIDEMIAIVFAIPSIFGMYHFYKNAKFVSVLFLIYFIFLIFGSMIYSIFMVPLSGIYISFFLELKVFIITGATIYFFKVYNEKREEPISVIISKVVILYCIIFSLFLTKDLLFSDKSISGIPLSNNGVFGHVPLGLSSQKVKAAAICGLAVASCAIMFMYQQKKIYIFLLVLFSIFLIATSSAKELIVIPAALIVILTRRGEIIKKYLPQYRRASRLLLNIGLLFAIIIGSVGFVFVASDFIDSRLNRFDTTTVRGLLYETSQKIAEDYFPTGSGAGTFGSQPTRTSYFSPLYHEYGLSRFYGASPDNSQFLMDTWWPKVFAESGFIGGASYLMAYLVMLYMLFKSLVKTPSLDNSYGFILGLLVISSSVASSVFTSDFAMIIVAIFILMYFTDKRSESLHSKYDSANR